MKNLILTWTLVSVFFTFPAQGANTHEDAWKRFPPSQIQDVQPQLHGNLPTQIWLYEGPGTWDTGRKHLKLFFQQYGYTWQSLTPERIKNGSWKPEPTQLLLMPGGQSWTYLEDLSEQGAEEIKKFLSLGGSYLGICAGAFYATSNREGGKKTGPYGIGLLDGVAYDGTALGTSPFKDGMLDFWILSLQKVMRMVLFGGPSFRYSSQEEQEKQVQVLARFPTIQEPAIVRLDFGSGRVALSGPHLEIEENLEDWGPEFNDPESDWPLLNTLIQELLMGGAMPPNESR